MIVTCQDLAQEVLTVVLRDQDEGVGDEVLVVTGGFRLGFKVHHSHFDEFSVTDEETLGN